MDDDGGNEWMVLFCWQAGRLLLLAAAAGGGGIRLRFEIFSRLFCIQHFLRFFRGIFLSFYLHLSIIDVCCLFVSCIHPSIAEFALISLIGVFLFGFISQSISCCCIF